MKKSELKLAIRFKEIAYNILLVIGSVLLSSIASIAGSPIHVTSVGVAGVIFLFAGIYFKLSSHNDEDELEDILNKEQEERIRQIIHSRNEGD
tara:strand:- start:10266 stop:10544 length:279 start_codon:yes stop_codon:yes gene_type:complete